MTTVEFRTPDYLKSVFLKQFNLFDALFGSYMNKSAHIKCYCEYAAIFGISDSAWLDGIYEAVRGELIVGADSLESFNMLLRAMEFFPDRFDPATREVASHRKEAMTTKHKLLGELDAHTLESALTALDRGAVSGNTDCMSLAAFLNCNGYFMRKSSEAARELIEKAALWNHPLAILMGLKYCKNDTSYHSLAKSVLDCASHESACEYVCELYGLAKDTPVNPVSLELEKRFFKKLSERELINEGVLKIIRSAVLTEASKVRLLSTPTKEIRTDYLPIDIDRRSSIRIPLSIITKRLSDRAGESRSILSSLSLFPMRHAVEYRPILLLSEDGYVLESYKEALTRGFGDSVVIRIDLASSTDVSFAPTRDNPIVNELNKVGCADAVVFLDNCDRLDERQQRELARFLHTTARDGKEMSLGDLSLDLGGILPILTAQSTVGIELSEECDTVKLATVKKDEKRAIIRQLAKEKGEIFGIDSLTVEDSVVEMLARHPLALSSSLIDRAVAFMDKSSKSPVITEEDVAQFLPKGGGFEPKSFWGCN